VDVIEHAPIFRLPGIACQWSPFECHRAGFVPDHVTYTWLMMIVLVGLAFVASRDVQLVPRGLQNFFEVVLEQFQSMIDDVIGPPGRPYLPLIATLGLFILANNLLSLVPGANGPTTNLNTTAACALVVFFAYQAIGIRTQGPLRYLKHFMGPVWWLAWLMFPIEVISHFARPLSLTLRLFGNMVGGHILLAIIFFLMGLQGLIGWALSGSAIGAIVGGIGGVIMIVFTVGFLYPLKILVSFLQAFVFVMLTMLYIAGAIEEGEHHGGEHQPAHH
jgi:F-type H+-transporting ATPase subunit a